MNSERMPRRWSSARSAARSAPAIRSPRAGAARGRRPGALPRRPNTTGMGCSSSSSPSASRAVACRVVGEHGAVPTAMASRMPARRRCTSARASAPVIRRLVPSAAAARPWTRRPLHGDARAAVARSRQPVAEERLDLVGEDAARHVHAHVAQRARTTGGVVAGVVDRVHDARDAARRAPARTAGAARVIAGLERHDRGRTARRAGGGWRSRRPRRAGCPHRGAIPRRARRRRGRG